MAFVNQIFPNPRLIHDVQISTGRPTTIVGNSVREFRLTKLRNYRKSWVWPSRAMLTVDRKIIEAFIQDVAVYSQNSFKFRAPDAKKWNNTTLGYAGSLNYFKLTERGGADTHPIFHLDSDVVVKLNGVNAAYTLKLLNGVPTIAVSGATAGSVVTITGGFFYAVRMNQADFSYGMSGLDVNNDAFVDTIGDLSLLEVFEYDPAVWA